MRLAVIFDVGGVLVESPFLAAMRWRDEMNLPNEMLHIFFEEYAKVPEPGTEPPMWHQVEMGKATIEEFLDRVRPGLDGLVADDHPVHSVSGDDFNVFREAGAHWQMVHKVRQLREAGHKTAILTNNVHEWRAWREVIPVDWFDVVIDSSEVGLRKPDPAIWQLTLERLGCSAECSVFLDDHPANVEAAAELGIAGVVVGPDIAAALDELDETVEAMMRSV
ncbi:MAG: HAD family phosphatase [Actinomycetia bacterium]|nr:HAD family phosphatase [Actinomycetes bacterium]MCP4959371.1 HAD family phosphatase [Actinomycetes bacterium]